MERQPGDSTTDSRVGLLLDGRYRLLRKIGAGGRGVVYESRHEEMGRNVAIKLLARGIAEDEFGLERFRREARAAGLLQHPNVVVVHDFCRPSREEAYLVMELCEGGNLADELNVEGKVSFARTAEVLEAVASAVEAAHEAGIVHRDLKPANILLSKGIVKVADFGLATLAAEDDPHPGLTGEHAVGSPHYMSPEQAQGMAAGPRSDQYALGVIAYELLTGFVPFSGATVMQILMKHVTAAPRPPSASDPAIPLSVSAAVLRSMEKDPERRFSSVSEFAATLTAALRAGGGSDRPAVTTKPVKAVTTVAIDPSLVDEGENPIGREAPLTTMNVRLLEALRGRGGFLLIGGEPGAGKTTLVQAFLARELAARPEIVAATGHCSEHFGSGEAYLPFLEIASRLTGKLESGRVSGFLRTLAPTWSHLLPALSVSEATGERLDAPALPAQERMPREFTDFLAVLSTVRPVILVLEDLHWADRSSVDLLGYLARRIGEMRLLVVATYRPSEVEVARHPLRQALRGLSSTGSASAEIAAAPFSREEVESFLSRELGAPVAADVIEFVHRRTEGNPLFVVNVLKHLNALGALGRSPEGAVVATKPLLELSDAVPEGLTSLILSRFERLEEDERRLLQVASVQGESFDTAAVSTTLEEDELSVEERLDRLHRVHGLVAPAGERELSGGNAASVYRFVHAFYQDALYDSVPPRRRAAWHGAIGRHLKARAPGVPEAAAPVLAVHFERARDFPEAIAALERAAEAASRRNPRDAGPLLSRAVGLCERLPSESAAKERARLLARLGRHFSESAEIVGDPGLYGRAEAAIRESLALVPDGPSAPEARTTLGLVHLERGENERALVELRAVVESWPRHAPAHASLAYLYKNTGLWDEGMAAQAAAGEIEPRLAHSIPRLSILIYQDRFEEAFAESEALLLERPHYSHYNYWKGIVHYYAGDLAAAREWIERGHDLDPDNFIGRGVFAFILAHHGEVLRARSLLLAAEPGAAADGTFTYWIAKIRAALGDHAEAVAAIARAEALGYWNAAWVKKDRALLPLAGRTDFEERLASLAGRQGRFRRRVRGEAAV
ncbi:MAG TPA: protein kinase [Thermoanaerobaculia bacterium]|nr:protein kinase [Thermoanaerobaculia bacterium]